MMLHCLVTFNDKKTKVFSGTFSRIIKDISNYCDKYGLETISGEWYKGE